MPSTDDLIGSVIQDKYRVTKLLGEGGMARVYKAEHTLLGRTVAVKVLLPHLTKTEAIQQRFLREARASSAVRHLNIITVEDVGSLPDGTMFIVMEHLTGRNLAEILAKEGPLRPDRAVGLCLQVLSGLRAAHERGIVHRDLKPENIFVVQDEQLGEVAKILDFGISKFADERGDGPALTMDGVMMGTPEYMAPEQVEGTKHVDRPSDIWATGVILYRMLSGRLPFQGENFAKILGAILAYNRPSLRDIAPEVPAALDAVIDRALAKSPENRYPSATDMIAALEAVRETLGFDAPLQSRRLSGTCDVVPLPTPEGAGRSAAVVPSPGAVEATVSAEARGTESPPAGPTTAAVPGPMRNGERSGIASAPGPATAPPPLGPAGTTRPRIPVSATAATPNETPPPEGPAGAARGDPESVPAEPAVAARGDPESVPAEPAVAASESLSAMAAEPAVAASESLSAMAAEPAVAASESLSAMAADPAPVAPGDEKAAGGGSEPETAHGDLEAPTKWVRWARAGLFYLLFLPLAWLLWTPLLFRLPDFSVILYGAYGYWGPNAAIGAFAGLLGLVSVAAVLLGREVRRRGLARRLSGFWIVILALIALCLTAWQSGALRGQIESHTLGIFSYSTITAEQGQKIFRLVASSHARFLTVTGMSLLLLWLLALVPLLQGALSAARPASDGKPTRDRLALWMISAGLMIIVVCELLLRLWLERPARELGLPEVVPVYLRVPLYFTWLVTAVAATRHVDRQPGAALTPAGQGLLVGAVAAGLLFGVVVAASEVGAYTHVPAGVVEAPELEVHRRLLGGYLRTLPGPLLGMGTACLLLFGLLWVHRLSAARVRGETGGAVLRGLGGLLVVGLSVLPAGIIARAASELARAHLAPMVIQMQPVARGRNAAPSFYIDAHPQAMVVGARKLWASLTGQPESKYTKDALSRVLATGRRCRWLALAALKAGDSPPPARCVTGIEARLYCEAVGKRLPTPEEWQAALGNVPPPTLAGKGTSDTPEDKGPLQRGHFAEWTMRMDHGSPTFSILGADRIQDAPRKLEAGHASALVGFRCVATFTP